jgi:predicted Zn finger-like uncharacterized protein
MTLVIRTAIVDAAQRDAEKAKAAAEKVQKKFWKRPTVIGISVIGVIEFVNKKCQLMNFKCPHCGAVITISGVQAGAQVRCGGCAQVFLMPQQQPVQQPVQQVPIASHAPRVSQPRSRTLESCKACGNQIARTATKCPQCGATTRSGEKNNLVMVIVFLAVVCVAVGYGIYLYSQSLETDAQKNLRRYHDAMGF